MSSNLFRALKLFLLVWNKYFCSGYKYMAERRQVMIGTSFLCSVGTKAALVCLSLYILNLLFCYLSVKIFVSDTE